eukprot:1653674-Amphidinium_carterae.1
MFEATMLVPIVVTCSCAVLLELKTLRGEYAPENSMPHLWPSDVTCTRRAKYASLTRSQIESCQTIFHKYLKDAKHMTMTPSMMIIKMQPLGQSVPTAQQESKQQYSSSIVNLRMLHRSFIECGFC